MKMPSNQKNGRPAAGTVLRLSVVVIVRIVFFTLIILGLDKAISPGTSPILLSIAAALGVITASTLSCTRLKTMGILVLGAAGFLVSRAVLSFLNFLPEEITGNIFSAYALSLHINLVWLSFLTAGFTTWFFLRFSFAAGIEALIYTFLAVVAVSGHRNFHFESPQILNTLAWRLGIEPLKAIVLIGMVFTIGLISWLLLGSLKTSGKYGYKKIEYHSGRLRPAALLITVCSVTVIFMAVSQTVYRYFNEIAQTRAANGVGQKAGENLSPLGFHSSIGGSNQPSALVRLEGDYPLNPYTPMFYLRENALSQFNGREFVMGPATMDRDAGQGRPDEAFEGQEDTALMSRTPLVQAVYLLANHEKAFASDYPVSIKPLKNPNPARFKGSYKAYSIAPSFNLESIKGQPIGDPRWSEDENKIYHKEHADPRYKKLATDITLGITDPVEKAFAITDWLSKKAIYTLKPGHEVPDTEDPVAPFLFGDLRGYCVHFAHAVAYMLRAVGVPSRVATGYLTDLSESKDGHILLRMSDRHAWAEVFVDGKGWLPFDVKPEKVESAAETPVDMKLLEELMGLIGPDEEILPKEVAKDEKGLEEVPALKLPEAQHILWGFAILLSAISALKIYILASSGRSSLKNSEASAASSAADLSLSFSSSFVLSGIENGSNGSLISE